MVCDFFTPLSSSRLGPPTVVFVVVIKATVLIYLSFELSYFCVTMNFPVFFIVTGLIDFE